MKVNSSLQSRSRRAVLMAGAASAATWAMPRPALSQGAPRQAHPIRVGSAPRRPDKTRVARRAYSREYDGCDPSFTPATTRRHLIKRSQDDFLGNFALPLDTGGSG